MPTNDVNQSSEIKENMVHEVKWKLEEGKGGERKVRERESPLNPQMLAECSVDENLFFCNIFVVMNALYACTNKFN